MGNDYARQRQVDDTFKWLSGYGGNTLIGVQCMPIVNVYEIWDIEIERWGVLRTCRSQLWSCEVFDTNCVFGPFGFIKESLESLDVQELIHHASLETCRLPFDLNIPTDTI